MKIKNSTPLATEVLNALVRWTLKQCDVGINKCAFTAFAQTPKADRHLHNAMRYGAKHFRQTIFIHRDALAPDTHCKENLFSLVCAVAWHLNYVGGPRKPQGEFAMYRQQVGATFNTEADRLIPQWMTLIKPPDPLATQHQKIARLEEQVNRWERRAKLARTKLKIWNRRLTCARNVLIKKETP